METKLYNVDLQNELGNWNGAPVAGKKVLAKIQATEYVPNQTGTYYDFVNKLTYPIYKYEQKIIPVSDETFVTEADGSGSFELNVNPKYSYEVKLLATDDYGKITIENIYFNGIENYSSDIRYGYDNITPDSAHLGGYNLGEEVNLHITHNGKEEIKTPGKFLFMRLQNGLRDYTVKNDSKYSFTYNENDVPNVYIASAWFDGYTYHEVSASGNAFNILFNKENKKLKIDIKSDKDKYKPGEDAILNVSVKDADGNSVKAKVNISAVDVAIAELGGINKPTPLENLYQSVSSGWRLSVYSHKNLLFGGTAEGGGGDGDGRSYFPDLALFIQVETGNDGKATVKFHLPDTITSWQLSTQAISDKLEAGATSTKINVSLPFFVDANFSQEYVKGDEPVIKATAYGDSLNATSKVQSYLEAPTLGVNHNSKEVSAFTAAYFNLGKLETGKYDFKIGSIYKSNLDAIIASTTVISSRLSQNQQVVSEIKSGSKIAGSDKNWTTITLMDNNRGRYFSQLTDLSYVSGARLDQKLSSVVSNDLLNKYFNINLGQEKADLKIYQTEDGGIALLPYSTADLRTSVLMAMISPDAISRDELAQYFYRKYNSSDANRDELALTLSGLAALNEPVLIQLREFSKVGDLTPLDKIYLALGAQKIGDDKLAQDIYSELMTRYGEKLDPYVRLKIDEKNNDNNSMATALVSIVAAGLNDSRCENLWNYAKDNLPNDELTNIERLLYLKNVIANIPAGNSKFTVKIDNKEITKELKRGENYMFKVSPEQLKNLKVNVTLGNIVAVSEYEGAAELTVRNNDIAISKTYWNNGKETNSINQSDIIEIRIKPQFNSAAIDGSYEITDILPSGLKLLTNTYSRNIEASCSVWYPYENQGQKVKFIIDKNWNKSGNCNRDYISYFARVSQPGKYIIEPIIIQSIKAVDMKNFSGGGQFIINQ